MSDGKVLPEAPPGTFLRGEARRDVRYRIRLAVTLSANGTQVSSLTEDISLRGMFVRTDNPPDLRHLVRLRVTIPTEPEPLDMLGVVAHVVGVGHPQRVPGAGIQFYGLSQHAQQRWERFIHHIRRSRPESTHQSILMAPVDAADPVRRAYPRFAAELVVRLADDGELRECMTQNVSVGGMFLTTPVDVPEGTELLIHLVHPRTGAWLPMNVVVRRRVREGGRSGLGVEITEPAPEFQALLEEFYAVGTAEDPLLELQ
ncbi:MAG: PilZ domain-containing protein [Myxococcota bacterium]